MDIKEILERINTDPDYRAQLQSELAFPMYQPGHAVQPVEQIDKLEASFGSIDDLINSIKVDKNVDQDSASDYSNYGSQSSVEVPSFEATNLAFDKDVVDFDEAALDDKINEGMVAGLNSFINEAYAPHAMDYLASDDIYDPTQLAIKKYNNSEADKYFDKAIDQDTYDDMAKDFQRFNDIKNSDDPENRRVVPNAAPLEDVGDTTPAEDLAHYEEALKILQERKADRVKALENARANMAAAAWMYRKDPSMLSALFGEKASKDLAKVNRESQKSEEFKAYKKKAEVAYNALSDEVQGYDKQDKDQTMLIKKLVREYRNALEDANLDERFDDDMEALGIDTKKLRKLDLDWKKNGEVKESSERAPEVEAISTQTVKEKLESEEMKTLIDKGKTSDIDNKIKELNAYKDQLKNNNKENDSDKQATSQAIDDIITKLEQRKKENEDSDASKKLTREANKSFESLSKLTDKKLTDAIDKHNAKFPKRRVVKKNGVATKDGWK